MTARAKILERLYKPGSGCIFVFAGPSGAGKTTVCRALLEALPGVNFSVSHTTRRPRGDEREGREYYFVSKETFERMARGGEFAEYATVHGRRYGTSRKEMGDKLARGDVMLDIDVQGAAQIRARYPEAVSVFILPPSLPELRARLEKRKENDAGDIERRVAAAKAEMEAVADFDYFIINDRLDEAVEVAKSVIQAERRRVSRRMRAT
jgi:guanylate kinase